MRVWGTLLAAIFSINVMSAASPTPVLLELFTSEGCSSCPPADRILQRLDRDQPVNGANLIVISEHVDYWNRLGWADPLSSAAFSARQRDYADRLRSDDVYTPQLIVDGRAGVVGSDAEAVSGAIRTSIREPKLKLIFSAVRSGDAAVVHIESPSVPSNADLFVVAAIDHVASRVSRGENAGRDLTHVAVAYSFRKLAPRTMDIRVNLKPGASRLIVFLQDRSSGRVLAVSQTRL